MPDRPASRKVLALVLVAMALTGFSALPAGAGEGASGGRAPADHAPIMIDGDAQLTAANGVSGGDGSQGNPYIIENFMINTTDAPDDKVAISIVNTTKYLTIRNCLLTGDPADDTNTSWGVRIYGGLNLTVEGCTMHDLDYGVMGYSSSDTIKGNEVFNCRYGISMGGMPFISFTAEDNVITGNTVHHCKGGMIISLCEDFIIEKNTLHDNNMMGGEQIGILLQLAERTVVRENNVTTSETALHLQYSNESEVYHNTFYENEHLGLALLYSYRNLLYENNLIDNVQYQALDYNGSNIWNTSEKGNYWSDYNGTDADQDGIGDTSRGIPKSPTECSGYDYMPLMAPWGGGAPPANKKPAADIVLIHPNPADQGMAVSFNGTGTDEDGTVVACKWTSSIDGFLSDDEDFTCSSLSVGSHDISFEVQDDDGAWSDPHHETLVISLPPANQEPTASMGSPADNSTVSGNVTVSGTADDPDGTVERVEVQVDDGNWTNATISGRAAVSWTFAWDTTSVADGGHVISARSFDGKNYSEETEIRVKVSNAGPPDQPPAAVSLSHSNLTNTSVKVHWTKCTESDFRNYTFYYSMDNITWTIGETFPDPNTLSFQPVDMTPNTTYYGKVRVHDTGGLYNDSNVVKVTTLPEQPPVNARPKVTNWSSSRTKIKSGESVTFTVRGEDTDGNVTSYYFDFGDGTNSSWVAANSTTHEYSKTGTFTVQAKLRDNGDAESDWKTIVIIKVEKKAAAPTPSTGVLAVLSVLGAVALVLGRYRKR